MKDVTIGMVILHVVSVADKKPMGIGYLYPLYASWGAVRSDQTIIFSNVYRLMLAGNSSIVNDIQGIGSNSRFTLVVRCVCVEV